MNELKVLGEKDKRVMREGAVRSEGHRRECSGKKHGPARNWLVAGALAAVSLLSPGVSEARLTCLDVYGSSTCPSNWGQDGAPLLDSKESPASVGGTTRESYNTMAPTSELPLLRQGALSLISKRLSTNGLIGSVASMVTPRGLKSCLHGSPQPVEKSPQQSAADAAQAGQPDCGGPGSSGSHVDNLRWNYVHIGVDYATGDTHHCANQGCQGVLDNLPGQMQHLEIKRIHRPLDSWQRSAFGPGTYTQFDHTIELVPPDSGFPATISLNDPEVDSFSVNFSETSPGSGIFKETQTHLYKQFQTFNASGGAPASQYDATKAILTAQTGETWVFDILHHFGDPMGRLAQKTDRDGNATVIAYQFQDSATDAAMGYDPEQLFKIASITDPYGKKATLTYTNEYGRWAVSSIALPNSTTLTYGYNQDGSGNVFLESVTYPDTNTSWFGFWTDDSTQDVVFWFDDVTTPENESETVNLTPSYWVSPSGNYYYQSPSLARTVYNADGEVSYKNWEDATQADVFYIFSAPGKLVRINTATSAVGYPTEVAYADGFASPDEPLTNHGFDPETYKTDAYSALTQRTSSTGFSEIFARDTTTRAITSVTYPGTLKASATYNGFRQPTSITDINGILNSLTWDAKGNLTKAVVASGKTEQATINATYNSKGQPLTYTDANGNVTTYTYDTSSGNLLTIVEPKDNAADTTQATTTFGYDSAGRVTSKTDALTHKTTYSYDNRGRLYQVTDPYGKTDLYTYSARGSVSDYKDRNGNITHYDYDTSGRVTTVTKAYGTTVAQALTTTYYPGSGSKMDEQVPGTLIHYGYDQFNNVAAVTTPTRGAQVVTAYTTRDKLGRTTYTQDEQTFKTMYVYDTQNRVSRKVRELCAGVNWTGVNLATVARDAASNPCWAITDYAYDNAGNVTQLTDELGTITKNTYDAQNRLTSKVAASGTSIAETESYSYDAVGNQTKVIRGRSFGSEGNSTHDNFRDEMTYTARNLLKTRTEAVGRTEQVTAQALTYTLTKQKATEADGNGNITNFKYDNVDRLIEVDDPLGNKTLYTYDNVGNKMSSTDGNNHKTAFVYDALNRLTQKQNAATESTKYTYDDNLTDGTGMDAAATGLGFSPLGVGTAVTETDAQGVAKITIKDGLGRVVRHGMYSSATVNQMATIFYEYSFPGVTPTSSTYLVATAYQDGNGNLVTVAKDANGAARVITDGEGKVTPLSVNATGQVLSVRKPTGTGFDWVYDALGRISSITDAQGSKASTLYDLEDNAVSITNELSKTSTYKFDGRNEKVSETDELGKTTTFAYDGAQHLKSLTDAEARVTQFAYDPRGLKKTVTDSLNATVQFAYDNAGRLQTMTDQLGHVTTYGYDNADRMTSRSYSDALNDSFTYDKGSRLLTAKSGRYGNTITRTYTPLGQLLTEKTTSGTLNLTTTYGYDLNGNVNKITYPNNSALVPSYNKRAELTKQVLDSVTVATITRDDAGRAKNVAFGNGATETRNFRVDNFLSSVVLQKGTTTLASLSYAFDASKRKTGETNALTSTESQTFGFDDASRLASWSQGSNTQSWNLTATGDWTSTTRNGAVESRAFNNAHGITAVASVAVTTDARGSITKDDKGSTYVWDFDNQLKSATVGGVTTTYAWDALGRRLSKVVGSVTTVFANEGERDDARALAEYDNGAFARLYVYGGDARDEVLVMKAGSAKYYFTHGAQLSVQAVTNDSGAVAERYRYDAFGKQTVLNAAGTAIAGTTIANRIGFTGRYHDESGLVFFRTRSLDPRLGRFISRDDDFYDGPNLYDAYFAPNRLDPSGKGFGHWLHSVLPSPVANALTSSVGRFAINLAVTTVIQTGFQVILPGPAGAVLGGFVAGATTSLLDRSLQNGSFSAGNIALDVAIGGGLGAVAGYYNLGQTLKRANDSIDVAGVLKDSIETQGGIAVIKYILIGKDHRADAQRNNGYLTVGPTTPAKTNSGTTNSGSSTTNDGSSSAVFGGGRPTPTPVVDPPAPGLAPRSLQFSNTNLINRDFLNTNLSETCI